MSLPESSSFVPLKREKLDVLLWTKPRPRWHAIVGILCFIIAGYLLYTAIYDQSFVEKYLRSGNPEDMTLLIVIPLSIGIMLTGYSKVYFDLANKRFKDQYGVGPLRFGLWQKLPPLNYISVFMNDLMQYEVNLWYNKNRHIHIETFWTKEEAIENGFYLANDLGIKLFDASERKTKNKYLNMAELAIKYSDANTQEPEREN